MTTISTIRSGVDEEDSGNPDSVVVVVSVELLSAARTMGITANSVEYIISVPTTKIPELYEHFALFEAAIEISWVSLFPNPILVQEG